MYRQRMEVQRLELAKRKYPHMMMQEVITWKRFLKRYGNNFAKYRYDVHVGKGVGRIPGFNETLQDMAVRITQKRIDVVAARGAETYIIEIKDRASMAAIGQLITYRELYEQRYGRGRITGLIIVAETVDPDIKGVIERFKIKLFVV